MNNYIRWIDQRTGFIRGWGLILYASLPSSLAMLDILEIKVETAEVRPEFLVFGIVPMLVLFLLIRAKHKDWFLDRTHLNKRALFTLIAILIISTCICGTALLIKEGYTFSFSSLGMATGGSKAFLMGISSLVVSAALFMSILSKKTVLPGIPDESIVDFYKKIRPKLILIQKNEVWRSSQVEVGFPEKMLEVVNKMKTDLETFNLEVSPIYREEQFNDALSRFKEVLEHIRGKEGMSKELQIKEYFKEFWKNRKGEEKLERIRAKVI